MQAFMFFWHSPIMSISHATTPCCAALRILRVHVLISCQLVHPSIHGPISFRTRRMYSSARSCTKTYVGAFDNTIVAQTSARDALKFLLDNHLTLRCPVFATEFREKCIVRLTRHGVLAKDEHKANAVLKTSYLAQQDV